MAEGLNLGQIIAYLGLDTKSLERGARAAIKKIGETEDAVDKLIDEVDALDDELDKSGKKMKSTGSAADRLTDDVSELKNKLTDTSGSIKTSTANLDKLRETVGTVSAAFAAVAAAAVAAGAAFMAHLWKSASETIDKNYDLAQAIGATSGAVQTLTQHLGDNGVEANRLQGIASRLNSVIGDAIRQGGPAADAFKNIGVNVRDLVGMDADEKFATIADGISKLGTRAEMASAAGEIFGKKLGTELVPALAGGAEAVRAAREELESYGAIISDIDAESIGRANDAMQRIGVIVDAVYKDIAIKLAPYLEVAAELFKELARESGGFGDEALAALDGILKAGAFVGDMFRGLQVAVKGLETVFIQLDAGAAAVLEGLAKGAAWVIDTVIEEINRFIRAVNLLPGVDISEIVFRASESEMVKRFGDYTDAAMKKAADARDELHELAMRELPSDALERYMAKVEEAARKASEAAIGGRTDIGSEAGGLSNSAQADADAKAKEAADKALAEAKKRAEEEAALETQKINQLLARVEAIRQANLTETELAAEKYAIDLEMLRQARENEILTEEEFNQMKEDAAQRHEDNMTKIKERAEKARQALMQRAANQMFNTVQTSLQAVSAVTDREGKKGFEKQKKIAIASAMISAAQGIAMTLGQYPFPLSAVMAAAQGVLAIAQINEIKGQSYEGGGGTPSTPTAPAPATAAGGGGGGGEGGAGPGQTMFVEGISPDQFFSGKTMRDFSEALLQHQRDGGQVVFSS